MTYVPKKAVTRAKLRPKHVLFPLHFLKIFGMLVYGMLCNFHYFQQNELPLGNVEYADYFLHNMLHPVVLHSVHAFEIDESNGMQDNDEKNSI